MRNLHFEAAIWYLFTSTEFFESTAQECDQMTIWFGQLAIARGVADFGRNNQIFDTFKKRAREFRRGAELAKRGDYRMIWDTAGSIRGDARGMLEQPIHSWMSEAEYEEFNGARMNRLLTYAGKIARSLNNAFGGAESFFNPSKNYPERSNDDDGFPGDEIVKVYESNIRWYKDASFWALPKPLPEYVIDRSIACRTGDEVPWTGVWFPETGLEKHSLTFAVKGLRMQPVYRVIKTAEELRTEEQMFPNPQTVAVATIWHPVVPSGRALEADEELWAKAGQLCPKAGIWEPTDPGAARRKYELGEPMADLRSAHGFTVWRWVAER